MAVPAYKRKQSKTKFVDALMKLCSLCGYMSMKMPSKYRYIFMDRMINLSADALTHATIANKIFLSDSNFVNDYTFRRNNFLLARGEVFSLSAIGYIVCNLYEHSNDQSERKMIMGFRKNIGELCGDAIKSLNGILKFDKDVYAKKMKKKINEMQESQLPFNPQNSYINYNLNTLPITYPVNMYGTIYDPLKVDKVMCTIVEKDNRVEMCKII